MKNEDEVDALKARARSLIERLADGSRDEEARDRLLDDILAMQSRRCAAYGRLVQSQEASLPRLPAVPSDVFRFARVSVFPPTEVKRTFRTSGTTDGARGAHYFRDLSLYDQAARTAASLALFQGERKHLVVLAPTADEAPDSSLSYMLGRFGSWFATQVSYVWKENALDLETLRNVLERATNSGESVALLGTSFAFVHAEDAWKELTCRDFALPQGSLVMQTGGFKGRSRTVEPAVMRQLLSLRYGVPEERVLAEYGMTELSSQMYESCLMDPSGPRRLWVPGWMRAEIVDPETLAPTSSDVGILRIEDVANVDSAAAVQTSDLCRHIGDGIEVLGRAPGSTPRGCSIAVDAALGT